MYLQNEDLVLKDKNLIHAIVADWIKIRQTDF